MLRFTLEAKAASALNHPNVAVIHDAGDSGGVRFIVMEHVEGHTLAAKIAGHALPATEVIDVALQVADALDAAHARGITHRDIKPANVMLTPRGQVKVLDFGIAKTTATEPLTGTDEDASPTLTAVGSMIGSASHMSPEQIVGDEVDGRSDLFSLGVTMYEMATGPLPFVGATRAELIGRILHAPPDSITHQNVKIPLELERIIFSCLEKSVERRYRYAGRRRQPHRRPRRHPRADRHDPPRSRRRPVEEQLPFLLRLAIATLSAADGPLDRALALCSAQELASMPRIVPATVKPERATPDAEGYGAGLPRDDCTIVSLRSHAGRLCRSIRPSLGLRTASLASNWPPAPSSSPA
jgi:serine/threonine protein kinase